MVVGKTVLFEHTCSQIPIQERHFETQVLGYHSGRAWKIEKDTLEETVQIEAYFCPWCGVKLEVPDA